MEDTFDNPNTDNGFEKPFLSTDEAARLLCMSKSTLYKHVSAGRIPRLKPNGKLILFETKELKKWARRNQ